LSVNGILLLYHQFLNKNASTIDDHINSFGRYSKFAVWPVNTELGFPSALNSLKINIIVLHYSLWHPHDYKLNQHYIEYLEKNSSAYKIAFYQDEYHYCKKRFAFINQYNIDCIYTLLEPFYFADVYLKYTDVRNIISNIPGYVADDLLTLSQSISKPDAERNIDIGYRGRPLPAYMGRGAQEKADIAYKFKEFAQNRGLRLDISASEESRIYGRAWYEFVADCRAVLGVEAGVSIFDLQDKARLAYERLLAHPRSGDFAAVATQFAPWENNIYYRTISPRHFEAAALRVCQILFEGRYSGIMKPMVHYLPLKKDFSNFTEIMELFGDAEVRRQIADNAHRDLIASGLYTYRNFIQQFDAELRNKGFNEAISPQEVAKVTAMLNQDLLFRKISGLVRAVKYYPFAGRKTLSKSLKSLITK